MSIAEQITALSNDRDAIRQAILDKGGTCPSGNGFDDFATDIATIPSGGQVFSATIHVTNAKPNSVVTATHGSNSYTATSGADGTCDITVNESGTYTMSCAERTSMSCVVADNGSTVNYSMIKYLYYLGDQCTALSGGWTGDNYSRGSYDTTNCRNDTDHMHIQGKAAGGSYGGFWGTGFTDQIDLSGFNYLHIDRTNGGSTSSAGVTLASAKASYNNVASPYKRVGLGSATRQVINIDISELTSAYIVFESQTSSINIDVYRVWIDNIATGN